jgi:predicted cytidylate kinase
VYAGQIFREEAVRRGMSLAQLNELAAADSSVDRALDERQVELLRGGGLVLESRLSGWLAHRDRIPAFKIWLTADRDERIRRLVARDGEDVATQERITSERETRERDRYLRYYGVDLQNLSIYDLVVDSTRMSPQEVLRLVLDTLPDRR